MKNTNHTYSKLFDPKRNIVVALATDDTLLVEYAIQFPSIFRSIDKDYTIIDTGWTDLDIVDLCVSRCSKSVVLTMRDMINVTKQIQQDYIRDVFQQQKDIISYDWYLYHKMNNLSYIQTILPVPSRYENIMSVYGKEKLAV